MCLAGWPDHPRRAVDQKRDEPAHAKTQTPLQKGGVFLCQRGLAHAVELSTACYVLTATSMARVMRDVASGAVPLSTNPAPARQTGRKGHRPSVPLQGHEAAPRPVPAARRL